MDRLNQILRRIDGQGYKAYQSLARQTFRFSGFTLEADYVQADPYAPPSRLRLRVPQHQAGFPTDLFSNRPRQIALRDYLVRRFDQAIVDVSRRRDVGAEGRLFIDRAGEEILERSACQVNEEFVELRFFASLPASGRRILGEAAAKLLIETLPEVTTSALHFCNLDEADVRMHVECAEDADALRAGLDDLGIVAFVADGSVLPRRTGVDDRPLMQAVPFHAPSSLQVTVDLPNRGPVTGMGLPKGVTLIVGGGFHGKSTLLRALERGVYNHIPDDGRELVVTDPTAVKIRAEDGRSVAGVDISRFIASLPGGLEPERFYTQNASGSTSQAANIAEALEARTRLLLLDEDTSSTNFMVRDRRMQALVQKRHEPITPFVDQVRRLYDDLGISTVLVMGGSGDYLDVADTVIAMEEFVPREVTAEAKEVARRHPTGCISEGIDDRATISSRIPARESIDPSRGKRQVSVRARGTRGLKFGQEEIDLSRVEQLVEDGQVEAIGHAIAHMRARYMDGRNSLQALLESVEGDLLEKGLDTICVVPFPTDLVYFRPQELAAAINRLRTLRVTTLSDEG